MRIRDATAADRPALVDLWVASWTAALPAIDFTARRPWLETHLSDLEACGASILAAEDETGLLGFVTIDPATGVLDQLAVAQDRQGRGTGAALVEAAKARSPAGLHLSVNVANPRALALYQRCGFIITGTGTNPRSGLTVLHMSWGP